MPNGVYEWGQYRRDDLSDRRARPEYAMANTLKKITYPTGGTREFVYEGNRMMVDPYATQVQPDESYYTTEGFSAVNSPYGYPPNPIITHNFTIASTEGSTVFNLSLNIGGYAGTEVRIIWIGPSYQEYPVMNFYSPSNEQYVLANGNYRIEVYVQDPIDAVLNCNWKEQHISTAFENSAGGIRVKEIRDYDPVSAKTMTTAYRYTQFANNALTSGLTVNPLRFAHRTGCVELMGCNTLRLSTRSTYPLTGDGATVYYPEVATMEEGNGRVERSYSFAFDSDPYSDAFYAFPVVPPSDNSYLRKLIQETFYGSGGNLVKRKIYMFDWGYPPRTIRNYQAQRGWKFAIFKEMFPVPGVPVSENGAVCWRPYDVESKFFPLIGEEERLFSANGDSICVRNEYYYYGAPLQPVIKQQLTYLSDSTLKTTSFRYAFNSATDFAYGLSAPEQAMYTSLLYRNYLQPLEATTTMTPKGGQPVAVNGTRYNFGAFNGTALHLSELREYGPGTDYRTTLFPAYDIYGNLLEKYRPGGTHESYLWGYNGAYPVAVITGASYGAASALVSPSVLNSPASAAALRTHLGALRAALSGTAQVSTYTYRPSVGMASATDAKGMDTFYDYDGFMRLMNIRDQNNNIIKNYTYHYKPQ